MEAQRFVCCVCCLRGSRANGGLTPFPLPHRPEAQRCKLCAEAGREPSPWPPPPLPKEEAVAIRTEMPRRADGTAYLSNSLGRMYN